MEHIPVLKDHIVELFSPVDGTFIDATVGAGGHALAIAKALQNSKPQTPRPPSTWHVGQVNSKQNQSLKLNISNLNLASNLGFRTSSLQLIGLDRDSAALALANENLKTKMSKLGMDYNTIVTLVRGNFRDIKSILGELKIEKVNGILADLGMSSMQLDDPTRGFSFRHEAPLDMRMSTNSKIQYTNIKQIQNSKLKIKNSDLTAELIIKTWDEHKIADILWQYGEERFSRKIARAIKEHRRDISSTTDLAKLCEKCVPPRFRKHGVHPATKTFQALRITVNDEVDALKDFLRDAPDLLAPGGRLAVISFHSLEDRLVKQQFNELASNGGYEKITKKPIIATDDAIALNPRSRSAKLRCIKRV